VKETKLSRYENSQRNRLLDVFGDRHLVVEKEEHHRSVPAYSDPPVHRIPAEAVKKRTLVRNLGQIQLARERS